MSTSNDPSVPDLADIQHQSMVRKLAKSPEEILKGMTLKKVNLLHAALGIATEAGEILNAVKAHVIYGKPLDFQNLVEEAGDSEFYWRMLRIEAGFTRTEALQHNMNKLAKRYPNYNYSDDAAIAREDKKEGGETDNTSI